MKKPNHNQVSILFLVLLLLTCSGGVWLRVVYNSTTSTADKEWLNALSGMVVGVMALVFGVMGLYGSIIYPINSVAWNTNLKMAVVLLVGSLLTILGLVIIAVAATKLLGFLH